MSRILLGLSAWAVVILAVAIGGTALGVHQFRSECRAHGAYITVERWHSIPVTDVCHGWRSSR